MNLPFKINLDNKVVVITGAGGVICSRLAKVLALLLLIPTGFIPKLQEAQPEGVNSNIRILLGIVYVVCFLAQFVLLLFVYNINKKKVQEMAKTLGRENTIENAKSMVDYKFRHDNMPFSLYIKFILL